MQIESKSLKVLQSKTYCKFGNFRMGFVSAKLGIVEVS